MSRAPTTMSANSRSAIALIFGRLTIQFLKQAAYHSYLMSDKIHSLKIFQNSTFFNLALNDQLIHLRQ